MARIATCWECEAETGRPTTGRLRLASGASVTFLVCPACHRKLSRELAGEAAGELSFHAPYADHEGHERRDEDREPPRPTP